MSLTVAPPLPSAPGSSEPLLSTPVLEVETETQTSLPPKPRPPPPQCAVCRTQPSKYTCPGCSLKTCSAPCSSSHKTQTGCTGQRNKATYVPLTKYTWGTMMDDYVFLEEVGRKVGDVGREIVRGGYMNGVGSAGRGRVGPAASGMRGRGGLRRGGGSGGAGAMSKRDVLKMQLEVRDIDMELLPLGMEKRKANQSTWDFKNQTALLTIEFKLHKPIDPLAPSSQPREPPLVLLTHRNNAKQSLISLLRTHFPHNPKQRRDQKNPANNHTTTKQITAPAWSRTLLYPDPDEPDSFKIPQCVMPAPMDPKTKAARKRSKTPVSIPNPIFPSFQNHTHAPSTTPTPSLPPSYYSLDPTQPLEVVLKHKQFVEFPTVEVWEEFMGGLIVDEKGALVGGDFDEDEGPVVKKRKLNPAAMQGLLGGYGSDDDDDDEDEGGEADAGEGDAVNKPTQGPQETLSALANYAESDAEEEEEDIPMSDDEEGEGGEEVDPKMLLELLRQARNDVVLAGGSMDDEDELDWGDMDAEGEDDPDL